MGKDSNIHGAAKPEDPAAVLDRLAASFGEAATSDLLDQFATLLAESLADPALGEDRAVAHRVAGVAGTLGFTKTSRAWLAASHGSVGNADAIRRESNRALAIIAGRRENEPPRQTSV